MCATRDQQSFSLIEKVRILYVFNLSDQFIKIEEHNSCDFAQKTGYLLTEHKLGKRHWVKMTISR